jgi:hypothetical protein
LDGFNYVDPRGLWGADPLKPQGRRFSKLATPQPAFQGSPCPATSHAQGVRG